jgi:hypothetical protein
MIMLLGELVDLRLNAWSGMRNDVRSCSVEARSLSEIFQSRELLETMQRAGSVK